MPLHLPTELPGLYALMGVEALAAHLEAVTGALAAAGVEITAEAQRGLDEIGEAIAEHHARHNPAALARAVSRAQAELAAGAC